MSVVVSLAGATPPTQLPPLDQAVDVLPVQVTGPARTTAGNAIPNMQKRPRAAARATACRRQSFAKNEAGHVSKQRPSGVIDTFVERGIQALRSVRAVRSRDAREWRDRLPDAKRHVGHSR